MKIKVELVKSSHLLVYSSVVVVVVVVIDRLIAFGSFPIKVQRRIPINKWSKGTYAAPVVLVLRFALSGFSFNTQRSMYV